MIDIIYKTVKPSPLKNLQIIQKSNVQSPLHFFRLNFDKAIYDFLHPFLLLGEKDFLKNAAWGNE